MPNRRALIVVEQPERCARLVAKLTHADRCAMAVTMDPAAELRQLSACMLGRLLAQDGFETEVIVGERAAVRQLDGGRPPSLLVIDSGLDTRQIQFVAESARAVCPGLPILLITSHGRAEGSSIEPPVVILQKPVNYAELAAAARDVVALPFAAAPLRRAPACSTSV